MLRATPNMKVYRPADTVETIEAGNSPLQDRTTPSVWRSAAEPARRAHEHTARNLTAQGAYVLAEAVGKRQVILMATGSEVEIALAARALLQADGIGTRVVSSPAWSFSPRRMPGFAAASAARACPRRGSRRACARVGMRFCRAKAAGRKGGIRGHVGFWASAPDKVLYEKFGITAANVATQARALLK